MKFNALQILFMKKKIFFSLLLAFIGITLTYAIAQKKQLDNYQLDNFVPEPLYQKEWKEVQSKIDSNLPKSALVLIEKILTKSIKNNHHKHIVKAIDMKLNLMHHMEEDYYDAAFTFLQKVDSSLSFPSKEYARLLCAETFKDYHNMNLWQLIKNENTGEISSNFKEWNQQLFIDTVTAIHQQVLLRSEQLQRTNPNFLDSLTKAQTHAYPTLYDIFVNKMLETQIGFRNNKIEQYPLSAELNKNLLLVDGSFENMEIIKDKENRYFVLSLFQELEKFHSNKNPQDAYVNSILRRLNFAKEHFNLNQEQENYRLALEQLIKNFESNYFLDQAYFQLAVAHSDLGNSSKHSAHFKTAVSLLHKAILEAEKNKKGKSQFTELLENIKTPYAHITTEKHVLPNKSILAKIEFKNLQNNQKEHVVYYKIYKHSVNGIKSFYQAQQRNIDTNILKKCATQKITLFNKLDYNLYSTFVELPALESGYYSIIISSNENFKKENKNGRLGVSFIEVNNIKSSITLVENGNAEIVVKNSLTGAPVANAQIKAYENNYFNGEKYRLIESVKTDSNGLAKISKQNAYNFSFSVESNNEIAINTDYFYFHEGHSNETTTNTIFTDRELYRPAQTCYFKIISTSSSTEVYGNKPIVNLRKNTPVTISLLDANGEKIKDTTINTNEFGSCSGTFYLPKNRMNGRWSLSCDDNAIGLQVEEYKRPKFELTLNAPKGEYKLNDSVTITGKAMALSGAAISNAIVKLNVKRQKQFYYSWHWWRMPQQHEEIDIDQHEVKTNDKGEFTYTFLAQSPSKKEDAYYTFKVHASVTDLTGETREDNTSISIGDKALEIALAISKNVEKNDQLQFKINSTNLQQEFTDASGSYEIQALSSDNRITRENIFGEIDTLLMSENDFYKKFPLEKIQYSKAEKQASGTTVLQGKFNTAENKSLDLSALKNLPNGKYIVKLKSKDKYGTAVESVQEFTLFDKHSNKPATVVDHWIAPIKLEGEPGDKVSFVLASSFENALYTLTLINDNKREWVKNVNLNNSQQLFEIPITEAHRGGFSIQVSMTKNNRTYLEVLDFIVPYSNKRLNVKYETFRDKLSPGQAEKWKLVLSGPDATQVSAEMLASMYDAALDQLNTNRYYGEQNWTNHLIEYTENYSYLFRNNAQQNNTESCSFGNSYIYTYQYYGYRNNGVDHYANYRTYGWGYIEGFGATHNLTNGKLKLKKAELRSLAAPAMNSIAEYSVSNFYAANDASIKSEEDLQQKESSNQDQTSSNVDITLRKNFNETAFFYPHLRTNEKGEIIIEFTLPESLTKWKFRTYSYTQDLMTGITTNDILAQKDLMITSFAPRFFRANDKIVFSAKIDNISEENLNTVANLQLLNAKTMQPLNIKTDALNILVDAKSSQKAEWSIAIPEDVDAIVCRISASSNNFKDGEEIIIPVLKNKMLVRETMPFTIYSKEEEKFVFDRMQNLKSSTLKNHQYTVEFTANPAWTAIQSMPYLSEFPHECAEQTFSRAYANAITRHIMNSSPQIKAMFAEWEKTSGNSDALISALEKNPELKSVLLKETPWVNEAQNETEAKRRLAKLFNGKELDKNIASAVKRLMDLENNGWSWFDGGRPSFYITEHIVGGFGHLSKLNVSEEIFKDYPSLKNKLEDGIAFLDREINQWYLQEIKNDYEELPMPSAELVHYFYSRSFYPSKSKFTEAFNYYKNNVKIYWSKYSLQNQAMIALAFYRMGDVDFAKAIMKSLKERSFFSKEMGMYWKENVSSYYWYSAPIETQSLLIEAFAEVNNDMESVEKMRLWLLRNKQTNSWNSTKSTALACYALLLQGENWLSTNNALDVQIGGKVLVISNQHLNDTDPYTVQSEAGTGYIKTAWQENEIERNKLSQITVKNNGPSVAFGAAHWEYFEELDKITSANNTPLKVRKEFYRVSGNTIEKISSNTILHVGDKIKVRLYVSSDRTMEFIHLRDMRASAFEPTDVLSSYHYSIGAWYYQSVKDASVDFFFDRIDKGEHQIEYEMTVTHKGTFSNGISTIECMYAPEFSAHTQGLTITVE